MKEYKTIWCYTLIEAQWYWKKFMSEGWEIESPIDVKFNWRKLESMYRFKIIRTKPN